MVVGRLHRALRGATALGGIALLCGACDGSNLFSGQVSEEPPTILTITAPASVTVPSQVIVDVAARARSGVEVVEVRYSGAFTDTDRIGFTGSNEEEVARSTFDLIQALDSLIFIEAHVEDVTGRISPVKQDTIRVQ